MNRLDYIDCNFTCCSEGDAGRDPLTGGTKVGYGGGEERWVGGQLPLPPVMSDANTTSPPSRLSKPLLLHKNKSLSTNNNREEA